MIIILAILAATRATPLGQSSPLVYGDKLQAPSVFLCTWASVHPNIPSPDERWPRITVQHVGLMLAALIMPEVIIGLALRQRLAAIRLAEGYKGEY